MNPAASPPLNPTAAPRRQLRLGQVALVLGVVLVLAVIGLLALRGWLSRYLHSDSFRLLLSSRTAAALHAQGEYLPLHWSGNAAFTDGFAARGLPDSPLASLQADQIRAEVHLDGWLQPAWRIDNLQIQRLTASFQSSPTEPPTPMATGTGSPATSSTPAAGATSATAPAPTPEGNVSAAPAAKAGRLSFGPIRIDETNLSWPVNGATGTLRRAHATIEIRETGWDATATQGDLALPGWPLLKLDQARLRARSGMLFVTASQLHLADGGRLECSGELPLTPGAEAVLQLRYDQVPIRDWLPVDWRASMSGLASGTTDFRGPATALSAATVRGKINISGGKLEALPILDRIALFTQTAQFRSIQLQKATAEYQWQQARLTITKVLLESPGLLRISGGCVLEQDQLEGEFDLGVAASTLQWLPGARSQVFTVERDGYLWTKVRVRGPLRNLQEDLSGRLASAAGKEIIDTGKGLLEQGTKTFFDLLNRATQ